MYDELVVFQESQIILRYAVYYSEEGVGSNLRQQDIVSTQKQVCTKLHRRNHTKPYEERKRRSHVIELGSKA
jgi:hypothetical protein